MKPLAPEQARRIALAAQGFDSRHRSATPNWTAISRTIGKLHLLQIDSVNVLVRSHYLPLYARLGNYDRAALDRRSLAPRNRHLFECWAHEASLVPMDLHPLMRWRMTRARNGDGVYHSMDRFAREEAAFLKSTLAFVERNGPTRVRDVPDGGKGDGGWWGWSKGKMALETLFDHGLVTTSRRDGFERIYDVPARVIPADVLARETPPEREAFRQLLAMSGASLGIGTEIDLRDYFRLPVADARTALADCLADGSLIEVEVKGWKAPAYVHRDAKRPREAGGIALLSPFDPLVWNRERAERLFGFHYRIELYTPESKRKFGYYVLPFLLHDKMAGRLCLKADRANGTLLVNAAHHEADADAQETALALVPELRLMADWLGLADVKIARTGNLSAALRKIS
ncbi:MAG: YcaQ family DNA glycosylase [Rhizobiales bacterium]|nr:YcaQ family DNA glycosylase [Hyphomicrobiales bacterium]